MKLRQARKIVRNIYRIDRYNFRTRLRALARVGAWKSIEFLRRPRKQETNLELMA